MNNFWAICLKGGVFHAITCCEITSYALLRKDILMRETLLKLFNTIQASLFPELESRLQTELTSKEKEFVEVCCLCQLDEHVPERHQWTGRPARSRLNLFKAFVAKAVYNLPETEDLIEMVIRDTTLRRLCGWESASDVPSAATFSRAFAEFAESQLPQRVHAAMIKKYCANRVIGHISRDSTAIKAREKAVAVKNGESKALPRKPGRPRKGEERLPELTQMEKQSLRSLEENLKELPKHCNFGCKRDSQGKSLFWKGYKFHVDGIDGDIPASTILTSASAHDSQASIPLAQMSAERFRNLYDLMDAAYDASEIRDFSEKLGHVAVIDHNPRGGMKLVEMDPAKALRFNERSSVERIFSHLENHGLRNIRVRGWAKVFAHLMFGVLVVTVNQMFQLLL